MPICLLCFHSPFVNRLFGSIFNPVSLSSAGNFSPQPKKQCVPYLTSETMCDSPTSSHGSMLDSPATPSAALASPAAPAATHSEQAQPLSLTTKPEGRAHHPHFPLPGKASGSSYTSSSTSTASHPNISLHSQSAALLTRPIPFSTLPPSLLSPSSPFHQAALHSHHALMQTQPLSLVTKSVEWMGKKHQTFYTCILLFFFVFFTFL